MKRDREAGGSGLTIRCPLFALYDPMNAVGRLDLLSQDRDGRVREEGRIKRVLGFPRCSRSVCTTVGISL